MKILQSCDAFYPTVDGVISVVKNYATLLNQENCCVVAGPKPAKKDNFTDEGKFNFKVIRCASMKAPENYRNALPIIDKKFFKAIKNENFDIIHAHSPFGMGRVSLKLAKKQGVPLVATLHTQYHRDFERVLGKKNPLVKFMINYIMKVYNNADSVWTVNNSCKQYLRMYGYKGDIRVIKNATDFVYPDNADQLIKRVNDLHNLEGQKNLFIFVGRMAMYKNLKLLCDSLAILKQKNADFKMLFVGGGFDYDELVKYANDIGIADRCIFTNTVKNKELLQGYYLRSDLLIFPSTFDMASVVQIEASAHKTPAIVVKGSCSADDIVDGENGFLCEESATSFADRIFELCNDGQKLKEVGENAYKTLYRTWKDVLTDLTNAYAEIIEDYKKKHNKK